jgi:type VI secretion system protein ImpF
MLDRLVDPDSGGTQARAGYGIEQVIGSVRRDLEDLLNTRLTNNDVPPAFIEVNSSVVTYGLPDLSSLSADTAEQRAEIARIIERVIQRFDPRLRQVQARLVEGISGTQTVRFQIHAELTSIRRPKWVSRPFWS